MSLFCNQNLFEDIFYRLYFQCLSLETKMCWGVIFLLGGGFALASASQKSGLSGKMSVNILGTTCIHSDTLPRWRSIFGEPRAYTVTLYQDGGQYFENHVFPQWHFTLPRWRSIFWGPHVSTVTLYQDGVITLRTTCLHSDTLPRWCHYPEDHVFTQWHFTKMGTLGTKCMFLQWHITNFFIFSSDGG